MRKMLLPLALALMPLPLAAHDFWIDLPSCHVAPDSRVPVRFLIGDIGAVQSENDSPAAEFNAHADMFRVAGYDFHLGTETGGYELIASVIERVIDVTTGLA